MGRTADERTIVPLHRLSHPPSIDLNLKIIPTHDRHTGETWNDKASLERYAMSARNFDLNEALSSRLVRDGISTLKLIHRYQAHLLDVGCGFGQWSRILAASDPPMDGWEYQGLEITSERVDICREFNPEARFGIGFVDFLPFDRQSVDIILCSGVLTCVSDWHAALRELTRVSREYVVLLRTPVVKYRPSACCRTTVSMGELVESHDQWLFARTELHTAFRDAGLMLIHEDYTDEIHRVEGLDERLFWLNYLLRRVS